MHKSKKLSICVIPGGGGPVRTFHLSPWLLPTVILLTIASLAAAGFFFHHKYQMALASPVDQTSELEALRFNKASLETQLNVFAARVAALDRQMAELKDRKMEVAALVEDVTRQFGLPNDTAMDELLPYLSATVSWADNRNGVGGSEQLSSALSLTAVAGGSRDVIRGLNRDLDRLMMETDDTRHYLLGLKDDLSEARSILAASPLIMPVDRRISAKFGQRRSPFDHRTVEMHRGVDIPAPVGTLVRAPADATVLSVGPSGGFGLMLTLDHGYGLITRYAHLSETLVETGEVVTRGQNVARTGNSGRSTGPHLHYETIIGGLHIDPLKLLPGQVAQSLTFKEGAEALKRAN